MCRCQSHEKLLKGIEIPVLCEISQNCTVSLGRVKADSKLAHSGWWGEKCLILQLSGTCSHATPSAGKKSRSVATSRIHENSSALRSCCLGLFLPNPSRGTLGFCVRYCLLAATPDTLTSVLHSLFLCKKSMAVLSVIPELMQKVQAMSCYQRAVCEMLCGQSGCILKQMHTDVGTMQE